MKHQANGKRPCAGMWRDPLHWLAVGFGSGCLPVAPGTAGTAAAIPVYLLLAQQSLPVYLGSVAIVFLLGIYLCGHVTRKLGVHDHGAIVWDEIAGYLLTMTAAPSGWPWILAGFLLFRLFDIVKPWPINVADRRIGGGFGIMLDDILAGIYALAAMQLLVHLVERTT